VDAYIVENGSMKTIENIYGWKIVSIDWQSKGILLDTTRGGMHGFQAAIEIITDHLPIQIVAWNSHNGAYPHSILVEWDGYKDVQKL
jgi:hypothetical protein